MNCELVFCYPHVVLSRPSRTGIKKPVCRMFFAVDRDRPLGAIAFSFCEGSGSSVPLAQVQPRAADSGVPALAGGGIRLILPSAQPWGSGTWMSAQTPVRWREMKMLASEKDGLAGRKGGDKEKGGKEVVAPEILSVPGERKQLPSALSHFLKM